MNKITVISRAEFLSKLHTLTLSSLALFFIAPLPSLANLTPASENEPFLDDSSRNNATSSLNNNGVSQILPDASGGQAVADLCLFGICAPVNLPSPLENVIEGAINRTVKNQLRSLFTEQIPISGSEHEFYDSVATLPGEAFAPQFLPLSSLPLDTLIPPGDYEIPAHFYCTKIYSFDGRGNRFALARLSGRMSDVLSALYDRASRNPEITTNDVQGLSWAIQTGISYNDLSTSQKALVDQLIPDYRDRMRASLIDQLTETTNTVSRLSGNRLPGVNQILNDLGSVGDVINSLLQARQQILQTSYSSQALAEEFAPQRDVFLQGGVEATPWSRTQENVYMRFIAPDGALDDGVIQVRLDNASGIATGILTQNITSSVGVPEASGSQAITASLPPSQTQATGENPCPNVRDFDFSEHKGYLLTLHPFVPPKQEELSGGEYRLPSESNYHYYVVDTKICSVSNPDCTGQNVFDHMISQRRFMAPVQTEEQASLRVDNCSTSDLRAPTPQGWVGSLYYSDPVVHFVDPGRYTAYNYTQNGGYD